MAKKFKSDHTPEEWAVVLEKHRLRRLANIDSERERLKKYNARPEVKERRRVRDAQSERAKKRREWANSDQGKAWAKQAFLKLKNDPEKWAENLQRQRLRRTGFSQDMVSSLVVVQENKCAICETPFTDPKNIKADHNHETCQPRGLLCHKCNIIEGMIAKMGFSPLEYADRLHGYLLSPPVNRLTA